VEYSRSRVRFTFYNELIINSIFPELGSEKGGTLVSIFGRNFVDSDSLLCRFGSNEAQKVLFLTPNHVKCSSPKNSPGKASLMLSNNGFDYVENNDLMFTYLPGARVASFSPMTGSMKGGTIVAVYGTGFSSEGSKCHFGGQTTLAMVKSSTYLECVSPSSSWYANNDSIVTFAVSNAAENISEVSSSLLFTYQPAIVVHEALPSLIPTSGRDSIQLVGVSFRLAANTTCIYKLDDDDNSYFGEVIAKVLSSEKIECILPDISKLETTALFVKLSVNGVVQADCGVRLSLYKPIEIVDFTPTVGVTTGGTVVSIYTVSNAFPSSAKVVCSFGNNGTVSALKFTGSKITCKSPPHTVSDVALGVSINTYDFHYSKFAYSFVVENSITYVEPSSGSSTGGTTLSIYGTGFQNRSSLSCRFGNTIVEATYMSSTSIYCITPFFSTTISKSVPVAITNNGQDWTDSMLTFQ
jgi:hypothetical protein